MMRTMKRSRKWLLIALKSAFSIGAIWILYHQLDKEALLALFASADIGWLFTAFVTINLAQLASAERQRFYLKIEGKTVTPGYSVMLYYTGMLFNHVLPGGIGGDGYKAYILKRDLGLKISTAIRLMLVNRANGLLWLILIGAGFALMSVKLPDVLPYTLPLILAGAVVTAVSYSVLSRMLFKEKISTQLGASVYSFIVQGLVAVCAACLFLAIEANHPWSADGLWADYLMLFMASSVMAVLPVSVGGVGLRELTFFYGGKFLGLSPEAGVAVGLLYFLVNLAAALLGLVFFVKNPSYRKMPPE